MPDSKLKRAGLTHEFRSLLEFITSQHAEGLAHLQICRSQKLDRLTHQAHLDEGYLHMIRMIDPHKDALSMQKLFAFAENHSNIFMHAASQDAFRAELKTLKNKFEEFDPEMETLRMLRDKYYAHNDRVRIDETHPFTPLDYVALGKVESLYTVTRRIIVWLSEML